MQNKLPSPFLERLEHIYSKKDIWVVMQWFNTLKRPVYFWVNRLKWTHDEVEKELIQSWLPFKKDSLLSDGYFLESWKERDLWDLKIYRDGKIYLQSFSSQVPVQCMDLKWGEVVLDLTAAPGGKTSQISALIWDTGKVIAIENNQIRFDKMEYNLKKLGCTNVETIYGNAWEILSSYEDECFDAILFDAPCSSEGKINLHSEKSYNGWEEKYIGFNYKRQKAIIEKNIRLLKSAWTLIYSTCTLAPEENEGLVHFLLCNFPELSLEEIEFNYEFRRPGIKKFRKYIYKSEIEKCMRILPNSQSEGFFIAKLRKI